MRVIFLSILSILMVLVFGLPTGICSGGRHFFKVSDSKFNHNDIYKDCLYKMPPLVILAENGNLSLLTQDMINNPKRVPILRPTQSVILYCTGFYNPLAMKRETRLNILKDKFPDHWKNFMFFENGIYPEDEINESRCLSPMLATIDETQEKCANGKGIILQNGFAINKSFFLPLYNICFDKNTMSAIYTWHKLLASQYLFPEQILAGMPNNRSPKRVLEVKNPRSPFKWDIQEKIFRSNFSTSRARNYLKFRDSERLILIPAGLTPPGDFYFLSMKSATYILEGTVPMFSSIYHGNRRIIEILGRMLALQAIGKSIDVISGSFHILGLPDEGLIRRYIYLDVERDGKRYRPIPKFLYKIFYDPLVKKGIAFVTMNNPFFDVNDEDFPCKNILKQFMDIDFLQATPASGYTVYCDIKDLMKTVKDIPNIDLSGGILSLDIYDPILDLNDLKANNEILVR